MSYFSNEHRYLTVSAEAHFLPMSICCIQAQCQHKYSFFHLSVIKNFTGVSLRMIYLFNLFIFKVKCYLTFPLYIVQHIFKTVILTKDIVVTVLHKKCSQQSNNSVSDHFFLVEQNGHTNDLTTIKHVPASLRNYQRHIYPNNLRGVLLLLLLLF